MAGEKLSKKRKAAAWIVAVLIALTVAYIWYNSVQSKAQSSESSSKVYETVKTACDEVFGENAVPVTHDGVRKTAHFIEFFALGAEFCVLFILLKRESYGGYLTVLPFGLYVAVIDESIQILSDRGPEIKDVLLDYCGYFAALIAFAAVFALRRAIKAAKNRKEKV